jgi:1,4-dihydroxy-2-naphthoate octaprenyltransferase
VNNIRDINSDAAAGKFSIPVRIGREKAVIYHGLLLLFAQLSAAAYVCFFSQTLWAWLFLVNIPLAWISFSGVKNAKTPAETDPFLKKTALAALLYALGLGTGLIMS